MDEHLRNPSHPRWPEDGFSGTEEGDQRHRTDVHARHADGETHSHSGSRPVARIQAQKSEVAQSFQLIRSYFVVELLAGKRSITDGRGRTPRKPFAAGNGLSTRWPVGGLRPSSRSVGN